MHRLQAPDVIESIERTVGAHLGRRWRVSRFVNLDDRASHPAGILLGDDSDSFNVFVKYGVGDEASSAFRREVDGLAILRDRGGVRTALPVADGVVSIEGGSVLVLEAVTERRTSDRTRDDWRSIGTALASLHSTTGTRFGHEVDGTFGPLPQFNAPVKTDRWSDFVNVRRIEPYLDAALRSGNLPDGFVRRVHAVAERLHEFSGPEPVPTLLHGDAQQNNFLSTDEGALFVDASPFFGHPESDLAMVDVFEPVPGDVFEAYNECREIDQDFAQRCELWRIPIYLAVIAVDVSNPFGHSFIGRLDEALRTYA
jgi:fructosamine-3-kinase